MTERAAQAAQGEQPMSVECGECERDARGPHADDCKRGKRIAKRIAAESKPTARKPQVRTIRAWAVVCASGKIHGPSSSVTWIYRLREDVRWERDNINRWEHLDCGPHTVVALTGTVKVAGKGKGKP